MLAKGQGLARAIRAKLAARGVGKPTGNPTGDSSKLNKEAKSAVAEQLALLEQQITEPSVPSLPWVKRAKADTIFGIIILMNAMFIGIDLEVTDPNASGVNWGLWTCETLFLIVFLLELFLRARAEMPKPMRFFMSGWGAFDTTVTVLGCVDTWIFTPMAGSGENPLASFTVLRVFRLLRLVRLVRVLRAFSQLVVLIQTLADSIKAVAWMSLLLGMVLYTGSVVCVLLLGQPYGESDEDVDYFFGTLPRALFAHFCIVTVEGWPDIASASMKYSSGWSLYWIFMIVLTNFCLVNLMVGVIVERIMNNAKAQETHLSSFMADLEQFRSTLRTLFEAADVDRSGDITRDEIRQLLSKNETNKIMGAFGVNLDVATPILHSIMEIDGDGPTSFEEFYDACVRLSGSRNDVHSLYVQNDVRSSHREMRARLGAIEARVDRLPQARQPVQDTFVDQPHAAAAAPRINPETHENIQKLTKRMMAFEEGQVKVLSGLEELKQVSQEVVIEEAKLVQASKTDIKSDGTAVRQSSGHQVDGCCAINAIWNQPGNHTQALPVRNY